MCGLSSLRLRVLHCVRMVVVLDRYFFYPAEPHNLTLVLETSPDANLQPSCRVDEVCVQACQCAVVASSCALSFLSARARPTVTPHCPSLSLSLPARPTVTAHGARGCAWLRAVQARAQCFEVAGLQPGVDLMAPVDDVFHLDTHVLPTSGEWTVRASR